MRNKVTGWIGYFRKPPRALPGFWRWCTRIFLLWLVLGRLSPTAQRIYPDEQQFVESSKPQVCVHTELINEVEEWKIRQSLQLVREMGATTIVEFFPWAYLEPSNGQYTWRQADRIVRHAQNQGVRIIARMGLVPMWARAGQTTFNYIPEESFGDFADFVAVFAERYAGVIDHIIIWNEPNLAFEWGYQDVDPARYVRMLQAAYESAHSANPDVVILAGALAPTVEPIGSPHGLNDLLYLEAMYEAGAGGYFDALAVHTYGLTKPPDDPPALDRLNFRRIELVRDIMLQHGDGEKNIYVTESGWNDNPRWANGVRPSQRVSYTLAAMEWAEDQQWVTNLCIWIFRYPHPSYTYRDNFALVTSDFQPRAIYYALQNYARGWEQDDALWLAQPEN